MDATTSRRARGGGRPGTGPRPHSDARRPAQATRANLYDEVTARIIAELEAGRFPWVQPWGRPRADGTGGSSGDAESGAVAPGLPRNALTARSYSGVNILILWGAMIAHGFPSQSWLTFKQAIAAGGRVRKGEHGTTVVYADRFVPKGEAKRATRDGDDAKVVPFLKRFTVFNVAQCEGLRPGLAADPAPLPEREIVPVAEDLIRASGADFRIGGTKAFYVPSHDFVQVPPQPAFFDQINYYRTALHELTHYAVSRIMPHGRARLLSRVLSTLRQFGIIELPGAAKFGGRETVRLFKISRKLTQDDHLKCRDIPCRDARVRPNFATNQAMLDKMAGYANLAKPGTERGVRETYGYEQRRRWQTAGNAAPADGAGQVRRARPQI
ncbi:ArdC family protein [Sphingomonas gilva]|uniref:ArdC family protein n=1 Tax=Sphingomonas gilva TaxID=2305907 RepID=UPI002482EC21|nr:ArdC-like ssDNA-binding domain-containing protein [Sphingomonas gilva]